VIGITLDTGALIALERRRQRIRNVFDAARLRDQRITVPADVVAEWWRGRTDLREAILESVEVEPLSAELARTAGETLAEIADATLVDAVVMASAASRGDVVYTAAVEDLEKLRKRFPGVRVLAV
jgi:predicted nucleic acid-binding protein